MSRLVMSVVSAAMGGGGTGGSNSLVRNIFQTRLSTGVNLSFYDGYSYSAFVYLVADRETKLVHGRLGLTSTLKSICIACGRFLF